VRYFRNILILFTKQDFGFGSIQYAQKLMMLEMILDKIIPLL